MKFSKSYFSKLLVLLICLVSTSAMAVQNSDLINKELKADKEQAQSSTCTDLDSSCFSYHTIVDNQSETRVFTQIKTTEVDLKKEYKNERTLMTIGYDASSRKNNFTAIKIPETSKTFKNLGIIVSLNWAL